MAFPAVFMVPQDSSEIPAATLRAIERLLERVRRDRESLVRCGYGESDPPMQRLNALTREADELRKAIALTSSRPSE